MKTTIVKTIWIALIVTALIVTVCIAKGPPRIHRGPQPPARQGQGQTPPFPPRVECGKGPQAGGDMELLNVLRVLELTEDQQVAVHTIMEQGREGIEAARKEVHEAQHELHRAVMKGEDETAIRAAATAIGTAIGDEAVLKAAIGAEVQTVLTQQQQNKLQEIREVHEQIQELMKKLPRPRQDIVPDPPSPNRSNENPENL